MRSTPVITRWVVALAALILGVGPLASREVPFLSGRVVDLADLIDDSTSQRLEAELVGLEEETGAQIAVLTIDSLEGDALEDFSLRVVETWRLGRAEADDGALLLVARDDRKMRLEVGYGLEGRITDLQSGRILDDILRPAFRRGDFAAGIEEGVLAVTTLARGGEVAYPTADTNGTMVEGSIPERLMAFGIFFVVVGVFALVALFSSGCGSWFLYLFLMPFIGLFPGALFDSSVGLLSLVAWIVGFPLFKLWLARTDAGKAFTSRHPGLPTFANSGWSGGGGSFGGGGGFSGGGGSFGGGGASSSW